MTDYKRDKNFTRFSSISKENQSNLQWELKTDLNTKSPIAFHTAKSIGNYIYFHGGVKDASSNQPINELIRLNLLDNQWEDLTSSDSPYLMQHASVAINSRYFIIIGGWNGHARLFTVHIFDTETLKWLPTPSISGFFKKAGLTGHTANACFKDKHKFPDILIIGREGSIRTQRKFGNIYKLIGSSDLKNFVYSELPINMDSRSNHCTGIINSTIYVVGGRDDRVIDVHKVSNLIHDNYCKVVEEFLNNKTYVSLEKCPLTGYRKAGRRGQCLIPASKGFLISGGESFMNVNSIADKAAFLYVALSNSEEYYFLGSIEHSRSNGVSIVTDAGDAYYHGGIDCNGSIKSDFLMLKLQN